MKLRRSVDEAIEAGFFMTVFSTSCPVCSVMFSLNLTIDDESFINNLTN